MLLFLNLKTLAKKMSIYFVMIVLVLFFTIIGAIVVYNYYLISASEKDYYREKERSYSLSVEPFYIDEKLDMLLEIHHSDIQRIYVTVRNNNDYILSNYFGESSMAFKVQLGHFFDGNSTNQILIPASIQNGADYIGKTYTVGSEKFQVIGISSADVYEIPYQSLKIKDHIEQVVVVAKSSLKENVKEALVNNMKYIFQTEQIGMPSPTVKQEMSIDYFITFGIILLGILNISYIYISVMEKRKKQQAIFYILGCSKPKLISLYLFEILIIITVVFCLCVVFSKFLLFNIFNALDEFYYHVINSAQYVSLYISCVSPTLFVLLCQFVHFFNKTPFELKRK